MHDAGHADLCVLHYAGEAPESFAAILSSCPECRVLLEDLRFGSRLAARAAEPPPAQLQARVLAAASLEPVPWAPSRFMQRALALTALSVFSVMAVRWGGVRREAAFAHRSDALELDLARTQQELDALSASIGQGHELAELDDDIRILQNDAAALRRQLGG